VRLKADECAKALTTRLEFMVMRWIETKEKMPEFNESVIVYCAIYGRYIGYYRPIEGTEDGVWCNWSGESGLLPPTHWMPLQEAPNA